MIPDLNCAKIMFAYKQVKKEKNEEKCIFLIVKIYFTVFFIKKKRESFCCWEEFQSVYIPTIMKPNHDKIKMLF